jgi:hypothetical protein
MQLRISPISTTRLTDVNAGEIRPARPTKIDRAREANTRVRMTNVSKESMLPDGAVLDRAVVEAHVLQPPHVRVRVGSGRLRPRRNADAARDDRL